MFSLALVLCSLLNFTKDSVWAQPPYFCNGIVRQRPCDAPFDDLRFDGASSKARTRPQSAPRARFVSHFAKVSDVSLKAISENEGMWKGYIEGNGKITLTLEIQHTNKQIERLPMGKVELHNSKTTFAYRGWLPKPFGWSWSILALAK